MRKYKQRPAGTEYLETLITGGELRYNPDTFKYYAYPYNNQQWQEYDTKQEALRSVLTLTHYEKLWEWAYVEAEKKSVLKNLRPMTQPGIVFHPYDTAPASDHPDTTYEPPTLEEL